MPDDNPPPAPNALFAYGTLCDAEIRRGVLGKAPRAENLLPARATGYAALYYPGETFPALVPRAGARTSGRVITGLLETDWARLDAFEGADYWRGPLTVTGPLGTLTVQAYFPTASIGPDAPVWSLAVWTRRHRPHVMAHYRATHFSGH